MSGIAEGLAEVGQGALSARAVEPRAGEADTGHTHESACLNCGTPLVGSHCHACGQAAHVHRTLGAFLHDLLHGVFHFEGKVWRTLPMLVRRPGRLTREYIDGRRASYVSPIALFLFCVFLMFAVFHATENEESLPGGAAVSDLDGAIRTRQGEIEALQARRRKLVAAKEDTASVDEEIESKRDTLETLLDMKSEGIGQYADQKSYSQIPQVDAAVKTFKANPALAVYKLQTYAYKYSWALIPISVPFLWLLFPFSRRFHLYDHTVFVTYSLCFMTLLAIVGMIAGAVGAGLVSGLLFFVPPFHMYAQLKGAYGLSRAGALWRTVLLVWFAGTALLLFFILLMAQAG